MSRSRRKTPIFGMTTAESDKRFKVSEHRRERRSFKKVGHIEEGSPSSKAFGNPWASEKDGKQYWAEATPKDMRK